MLTQAYNPVTEEYVLIETTELKETEAYYNSTHSDTDVLSFGKYGEAYYARSFGGPKGLDGKTRYEYDNYLYGENLAVLKKFWRK